MVQTFWPLMTHWSPSSTAVVLSDARSDPEFGSEKPWHQRVVPCRMPGRNSFFCSSVPHCSSVGPTRVSPKKSPRIGALARANSSASATPCIVVRPLPPYSVGQVAQIQPPSNSFFGHSALNCLALLVGHLEAVVEPAVGQVLLEPGADLGPEFLGVSGIRQIHTPILPSST